MTSLIVVVASAFLIATGGWRDDTVHYDQHRPSDDARAIVSVWHAASKCGVQFGKPGDSLIDVMKAVCKGDPVTDPLSPFYGRVFRAGDLSDVALAEAAEHVRMEDGPVIYLIR